MASETEIGKGEKTNEGSSVHQRQRAVRNNPTAMNTENGHLLIKRHTLLGDAENKYMVEKFIGQGSFGFVAQCRRLSTNEEVAVKILKPKFAGVAKKEVDMLQKLRRLDPDKNNLVKFMDVFEHSKQMCFAFEMLDITVYEYLMKRRRKPLLLSEIRVIASQMLVALKALKSISVAHADIKPDNIMMVNHLLQPFRVKLIDFGLAMPVSEMQRGLKFQHISYRGPEVSLGLPLSEAVDMWSLGCVLAFLYTGRNLYPVHCELDVMKAITLLQGQPEDYLLDSGLYTNHFYSKQLRMSKWSWQLKAVCKFGCCEKITLQSRLQKKLNPPYNSFNDMVQHKEKDAVQHEDTENFLHFLKRTMVVDPEKRITPREALEHQYITGKCEISDGHEVMTSLSSAEDDKFIKTHEKTPTLTSDVTTESVEGQTHNTYLKRISNFFSLPFKRKSTSQSRSHKQLNPPYKTLDDTVQVKEQDADQPEDTETHFPKRISAVNPKKRISPTETLKHQYITGKCKISDGHEDMTSLSSAKDQKLKKTPEKTPAVASDVTTGFVEVKTRKTGLKRIFNFFPRLFKRMSCCTLDVIE